MNFARSLTFAIVALAVALFQVATGSTISYTYDAAGRLTSASYNSDTSINYAYDANGNLLRRSTVNGGLDSDGDGIPDAWTQQYFGHPTGQAFDKSRAGDDADGTGMTNLQKYLAGLNPLDPNKVFRITAIVQSGGFQITWSSVPGKNYRVYSTDALGVIFTPLSGIILAGTGETTKSYTDATANGAKRFYQVAVVP